MQNYIKMMRYVDDYGKKFENIVFFQRKLLYLHGYE